jgi:hydroxymethylpyrimidine/phosphomethylpyrimidine kinase
MRNDPSKSARKRVRLPIALTIAGSDSGGGAGIQADLKTFASLGVHGTSVITCLTAQNPQGVYGIQGCRPEMVRLQLEAVFAELPPRAIKTGMLLSAEIIHALVDFLRKWRRPLLIVDPVMVATSGARLLRPSAIKVLVEDLLPLANLVTPNLDEAALLIDEPIASLEALRLAARKIQRRFGGAALVKGGHLPDMNQAVDFYYDGKLELLLQSPFIKGVSTHGTGCTYSAAIAAYCAQGYPLAQSVQRAKEYIFRAVSQSTRAGRHDVLNCFWKSPRKS